jgi:hypothetical protein
MTEERQMERSPCFNDHIKLVNDPQCVGDRILHTICCSRTMDLGLDIAVHARKKSFLRHTVRLSLLGSVPPRVPPRVRSCVKKRPHYQG